MLWDERCINMSICSHICFPVLKYISNDDAAAFATQKRILKLDQCGRAELYYCLPCCNTAWEKQLSNAGYRL